LLKILSRITEPTEGYAEIHGRVGSLLEVGTGFHPELTGRENIYLNGAILGMKRAEIERKFDEIVAFAEIERFLDTPVKRYSSGMYVRLAFAVAAHLEPEILLVDEVLAVGDAAFQKKCLGKMGDVAREGRTVLFVSHNMGAIQRLCPQVIWLEEGAIKEIGASVAICEKYLYLDAGFGSGVYTFDDGAGYAVQFLRAELLNSQEEPTSTFRADEPIKFRITYRLVREFSGLSVALIIIDALGGSLWGVSDLDFFPELFEKRQPGTYVYECIAPANVLRPGTYQLGLGAGGGGQYFHHPANPPIFEVTSVGYWRQSYGYFGVSGGPIAVPMKAKMPVLVEEVSS
jgi:lipopolysaccharide transport system ATP-binding protein